ncbi:MAG TPA: hypothetical protein VMU41_02725 [Candidatus Binataceae bacterium]|nr:hypothetical protein [Candidatus Binataceae bacterium]
MLRRLFRGLGKRRQLKLRESADKALALHLRGEARTDDPQLLDMTVRMQMRWRARELHPWDRDLPPARAARKLAQQTLSDTEAALERLFSACPDVDVIELSVIEPNPDGNRRVMFGTVRRDEFTQWHPLSTDMRLRLIGLHYRLVDENLEALPAERFSEEQDSTPIVSGFGGDPTKPH